MWRTVIVISHRLSTLGNVDEIIVLSAGRVVEKGTYKELKRLGGVFSHMLEEQSRYSAERPGDQSIIRSAFVLRQAGDEPSPVQTTAVAQQYRPVAPSAWPALVAVEPVHRGSPGGKDDGAKSIPQRARVRIEVDGKVVGIRQLDTPVLTIGRLGGNDVLVPSQRVSRLHAKMRWENGAWVIEDADSLNGITYQGNRVDRHVLFNGDYHHLRSSHPASSVPAHFHRISRCLQHNQQRAGAKGDLSERYRD